jgi:hypothetical protein
LRFWALALCSVLVGCASQNDGRRDATHVIVPEDDRSPPTARIVLADSVDGHTLAEASWPGHASSGKLTLGEARLRGTASGEDLDSGIVRVRVSVTERVSCRGHDGARFQRLRTRYFPPPQIEQIRAAPGARLATRDARSRLVVLASERCGVRGTATAIGGKLWGEVINGHGLETITPMIRFEYRP